MSHPRLTRVLADWCRRHNEDLGYADDPDMEAYVASLIATDEEGIADRLEEALGKCSVCDAPPGRHDLNAAYAKAAGTSYHPYQPLVEVTP